MLASKYGVETEVVAADLSLRRIRRSPHQRRSRRKPRLYEVLVNNAGFGIHGDFASADIDQNIQLVNVQLTAALRLTKAVLPAMIARAAAGF